MGTKEELTIIRNKLFHGSADYTKNQPDLFIPHRFQILAPSQVGGFVEKLKEGLSAEPELLIYVHLPFCFSECLFCNSFPHKVDRDAQQDYLSHLLTEIDLLSQHGVFKGKKARCIYLGGGTPTSFCNADLQRILDKIASHIEFSDGINITSEAHPLTLLDPARIQGLHDMGVNRLSMGCQTLDPAILRLCNRSNTEAQIAKIVRDVQRAGMSINIDMMTGLPGQTMESVKADLEILRGIRPDSVEYIRHEIVNPLVVELYHRRPELVVNNDTLFELVCVTQEWMSDNGYEQNGRFTNDKQWGYRYHWLKEMPIIAFGSRARSYTKTLCYDKYEQISTYASAIRNGGLPIGRFITMTEREQMYRSLLLGLQIRQGLDIAQFQARFGVSPLAAFSTLLSTLQEYGCLEPSVDAVRLSKYGAYFVEDVCDFIMDTLLQEESQGLVRTPHSEGRTSARLGTSQVSD